MSLNLKVNLGCGDKVVKGWVNVDLYAPNVDMVADVRTVEFEPGSCRWVVAYHVVEHLAREDAVSLFGRVFRWLACGGRVAIELPEYAHCSKIIRDRRKKKEKDGTVRLLGGVGVMGGRGGDAEFKKEYHAWVLAHANRIHGELVKFRHVRQHQMPEKFWVPGENHLYIWQAEELVEELRAAGFEHVRAMEPEMHGGKAWRDVRVEGVRP